MRSIKQSNNEGGGRVKIRCAKEEKQRIFHLRNLGEREREVWRDKKREESGGKGRVIIW